MWGKVDSEEKVDKRALNRLIAGSPYLGCGRYLKSIEEIHRQEIYSHYEFERLDGKYQAIMDLYRNQAGTNWNQTLFNYFFKYLGDKANCEAYMLLANRVGYNAILRERLNPLRLEALLLGASGLLKDYREDPYTEALRTEAEYLMRKYNITPLSSKSWILRRHMPLNNPVLRLAQAATLFSQNELLFDKVIACRCLEDIEDIFMVEASDYWTDHYVPSKVSDKSDVKRLGSSKCNILGINLVVMLQYAYGAYLSDDALIEQAHNLLQDLKPEENRYTKAWRKYGIRPKSAFESQALIQIAEKHCAQSNCKGCYLGARAMEDFSWLDTEE
ncbi:MAG: DUF2851 family protein [Rikenellaceae bacterium]